MHKFFSQSSKLEHRPLDNLEMKNRTNTTNFNTTVHNGDNVNTNEDDNITGSTIFHMLSSNYSL